MSKVTSICGMPRIEGDFDLRDAAGRGRDARQHEVAQRLVVLAELALALQDVNVHARLVVRRRGEHLALLDGDGRVAVDDSREHAAQRLDAQGKRGDVEQQDVLDFARQNAALHRRADRDALVGVDALERLLARDFAHLFDDRRHTGGTAHQNDLVDVVIGKPRVLHGEPHGLHRAVEKIRRHRLELLLGQVDVKVLRPVRRHGDEGQIDVCRTHAGQLDLRLFRRLFQTLHRHLVLGQVDAVRFLELVHEILNDLVIPVVAAQMGVAVGRQNFEHAVRNFQNGDVERAAAQVVDHDLAALVLIQPVGERRRRRLIDDTQDVQTRDLARVLGRLTLAVREVRGTGDDRLRDFRAQIRLRVRLELGQNHRRDLLRRIALVVDRHFIIRSHVPLNGDDRPVGIGNRLTLCRLTDDAGTVLLERYHGRGRPRTLRVCDDDGLAAFHHRHARIGRAQVDTDNFTCHNAFISLLITCFSLQCAAPLRGRARFTVYMYPAARLLKRPKQFFSPARSG